MVVDRFQDRLAFPQQPEMLLDDVDVVGARIEGGQAVLRPIAPLVAVIVVGAEHGAMVGTQNLGDTGRQRRLAGRRIPNDSEDDRMLSPL